MKLKLLRRFWKKKDTKLRSLKVRIDRVTEAQAIAIEEFLYQWVHLGAVGSSRWTAFYADGDGNFRPKIMVDGRSAAPSELAGGPGKRWRDDFSERSVYAIDFDAIAWQLHA